MVIWLDQASVQRAEARENSARYLRTARRYCVLLSFVKLFQEYSLHLLIGKKEQQSGGNARGQRVRRQGHMRRSTRSHRARYSDCISNGGSNKFPGASGSNKLPRPAKYCFRLHK